MCSSLVSQTMAFVQVWQCGRGCDNRDKGMEVIEPMSTYSRCAFSTGLG
jgi:hypothetical protein